MVKIGIVGYGIHIPDARIRRDEYVKAWGSFNAPGIVEKAVPSFDEDSVGMGVTSARHALQHSDRNPKTVSTLSFASTTPPYHERMVSAALVPPLGLSEEIFITEHVTSTRAGTEALITNFSLLHLVDEDRLGLVVASDAPRASMTESLEHAFGAASAAMVLGRKNTLAEVEGFSSSVHERIGERFKPAGEALTRDLGLTAYYEKSFREVVSLSVKTLLRKLQLSAGDFDHAVIQQSDGRIYRRLASELGFNEKQLSAGSLVNLTGDVGCASVLLGLASVLDIAELGQRILIASYGSGCGSDAVSLVATEGVGRLRKGRNTVKEELEDKHYIDYLTYIKTRRAIV